MITVATMLWEPNGGSREFSRCYDERWVERLRDGFARNLTRPFRFVCFTDRPRHFAAGIEQEPILARDPHYGCYIEPFRMNVPMILAGLDTVVVGNVDHLADYCLNAGIVALPRDPFAAPLVCNGVALIPAGQRHVYDAWRGESDMDWLRAQPCRVIDDLWPGHVVSFKGHVARYGLGDARIVYLHGHPKMHELWHLEWVNRHWGAPFVASGQAAA